MHAPQIIWLVLAALSVGSDLARDGQPKTGKHSFAITFLSVSAGLSILYWGGFFGGH